MPSPSQPGVADAKIKGFLNSTPAKLTFRLATIFIPFYAMRTIRSRSIVAAVFPTSPVRKDSHRNWISDCLSPFSCPRSLARSTWCMAPGETLRRSPTPWTLSTSLVESRSYHRTPLSATRLRTHSNREPRAQPSYCQTCPSVPQEAKDQRSLQAHQAS